MNGVNRAEDKSNFQVWVMDLSAHSALYFPVFVCLKHFTTEYFNVIGISNLSTLK